MKKLVLFLTVCAIWIVTYYHPKPGTNEWAEDMYKTKYEPELVRSMNGGETWDVWRIKLNDKTLIYLPAQWTTVGEEAKKEKE